MADTLTLTAGTAVAHAILVVSTPLLTRLYRPEDFGVLSVYGVLVSTASVLACLGYEPAILLPQNDREGGQLLIGCVAIALGVAIFSLPLVLLFRQEVATLLRAPGLTSLLLWAPLNLLALGAYQALTYWGNRHRRFTNLAVSRVWQSCVTVATQLGGGLVRSAAGGLVIGQVMGQIAASGVIGAKAGGPTVEAVRGEPFQRAIYARLFWRYRNFPLYSTWGTLMNTGAFQVVPVLLSALFGPAVSGFYYLAYRLVNLPMTLLGAALGQVLLQRTADRVGRGGDVSQLVEAVLGRLLVIAGLPLVLVALVAPQAFSLLFGPEWRMAGRYVQVLAPLFGLQLIVSPVSNVLIALQKQRVAAWCQASLLAIAVLSLSLGARYQGDPLVCLGFYALALSGAYVLYLVAIIRSSSASVRGILRECLAYRGILRGI